MPRYRLALAVATVGLAVGLFLQLGPWWNPIVYLRVDLGTLAILTGLLIGALWVAVQAARRLLERYADARLGELRRESGRAHVRFIRRLDHEVKNPLTAIRAGLANLGDAYDPAVLASVSAQVDRLARLSRDLRKLAELESQPLDVHEVDVSALIREAVDAAREGPGLAGRQVSVALPSVPWPLPQVPGDADLLSLALHNLVDNALKFSRPGDAVEVRAYEDGEWCVVEVADEGQGIAEEDLAHVGEELFRGEAAHGTPGSGLGIALAQAVIVRHGGNLLVRSRAAEGTVVTVRLPLHRAP